nr:ATP synthase F0 subunit 8 [Epicypta sp. WQY003]
MPQMAPINWLSLFILFSIIFLIFNIFNYYNFNLIYPKKNLKKSNKINKNLIWKW